MSHDTHEECTAIILAAGKGTRMKSELPKVLCVAHGRPLLQYVISALKESGVHRLIAVVGYRGDLVRQTMAHEADLEYAVQAEQLGTGHAVMMCRELLESQTGPVVVVAGDSPMLQASSIAELLELFRETGAACVLGTLVHENPVGLGRIVRDQHGEFLRIVEEKDATEAEKKICEVNMSTYVFDCQTLLRGLEKLTDDNRQREYYITDLPQIFLNEGGVVRAYPVLKPIEALSVNTIEQLAEVERELERLGQQ